MATNGRGVGGAASTLLAEGLREESWRRALGDEFEQAYFRSLERFLNAEWGASELEQDDDNVAACERFGQQAVDRARSLVFPPREQVFEALNACPLSRVKVVILGQDPYHQPQQAHGLAFSVSPRSPVPPSLANVFRELQSDLDLPSGAFPDGHLLPWAEQGVLLLNTCLTVRRGKPLSHEGKGWEMFTNRVLEVVSKRADDGVVFLLWGKNAQSRSRLIDRSRHAILTASHPSPLSAHSGFFGCRHFSKANELLIKAGREPVRWAMVETEPETLADDCQANVDAAAHDGDGDGEVGDSNSQPGEETDQALHVDGEAMRRQVFEGLVFVVCGLISEMRDIHTKIRQHGGEVTHLVTTQAEVNTPSYKVARVMDNDKVHIVGVDFVTDSVLAGARADETRYQLVRSTANAATPEIFASPLSKSDRSQQTTRGPENDGDADGDTALSSPLRPEAQLGLNRPVLRARRKSPPRASSAFAFSPPSSLSLSAPPLDSSFFESLAMTEPTQLIAASPSPPPARAIVQADQPPPPKPKAKNANWRPHWGLAKIYKADDPNAPYFPKDYDIVRRDVLNMTELSENRNKFYSMELHEGNEKGKSYYRIYTHYGRTDLLADADSTSNASERPAVSDESPDMFVERKECRYLHSLQQASWIYDLILADKSDAEAKGYKSIKLAAPTVGSEKGRAADHVNGEGHSDVHAQADDDARPTGDDVAVTDEAVRELVRDLYEEATNQLTSKVSAKITARGLETPLGILDVAQINEGEAILVRIQELLAASGGFVESGAIAKLSGEFYSLIPHKLGRSKAEMAGAVIDSFEKLEEKQELLQLMKDVLKVMSHVRSGSERGGDQRDDEDLEVQIKYKALNCSIVRVPHGSPEHKGVKKMIREDLDSSGVRLVNVFKVRREKEHERFTQTVFNTRYLFHGSRMGNWLGILSRGVLPPKRVTTLGVKRTDAGLLGSGMYFGETAATSAKYAPAGQRNYRMMLIATVALGNVKDYRQPNPELTKPPLNFHSCHGVKSTPYAPTGFADSEYVVYDTDQQRIDYVLQFQLPDDPAIVKAPSTAGMLKSRRWYPPSGDDSAEPLGSMHVWTAPARAPTRVQTLKAAVVRPRPLVVAQQSIAPPAQAASDGLTAVSALNPYMMRWTIEVRVVYLPTELFKWKKNEKEGRHFCCDLMDDKRDCIRAVAYNTVADDIFPRLKENELYRISGGYFKVANKKYSKLSHDYDITFTEATQITPLTDPARLAAFPVQQPDFVPLDQVASRDNDDVIAVIGFVQSLGALGEIMARTTGNAIPKRSVLLEDQSQAAVELTLWYDDAKNAETLFKVGDVLAVTGAWVNKFRGHTTLSTKHASYKLLVNPSHFPHTSALIKWRIEQHEEEEKRRANAERERVQRVARQALDQARLKAAQSTEAPKPASPQTSNAPTWSFARQLILREDSNQLPGGNRGSERPLSDFFQPSSVSSSSPRAAPFRIPRKATARATPAERLTPGLPPRSPSLASGLPESERDRFAQELVGSLRMRGAGERRDYLGYITAHQGLPIDLVQLVLSHLPYAFLIDAQRTQAVPSRLITSDVINLCIHRDGLAAAATAGDGSSSKPLRGRAGELLVVFDHADQLRRRSLDVDERDPRKYSPIIQPKPSIMAVAGATTDQLAVVPSLEQFKRRLDAFTNDQLRHLDWKNLFLAGGSVLACLLPEEDTIGGLWEQGDIDLWIVGLNHQQAQAKVKQVYDQIRQAQGDREVCVVRTKNAVSICAGHPSRNVQIILRLYRSPLHVLSAFDLDCVAVGWDGSQVLAMPRAFRALSTRTNFIDMSRFRALSYSCELRAVKYCRRGYGLSVYDAQRLLSPQTADHPLVQTDGAALAKMLCLRFALDRKSGDGGEKRQMKTKPTDGAPEATPEPDKSDGAAYDDTYIPYGPAWDGRRIQHFLQRKQTRERRQLIKSGKIASSRDYAPFFVFGGSLDAVMRPQSRLHHSFPFALIEQP